MLKMETQMKYSYELIKMNIKGHEMGFKKSLYLLSSGTIMSMRII
jgi:hypothetical protein